MLDLLDIKECIVTIDAMGTQTKIVNNIVKKEAYYCLCAKDNQETLNSDIREYFNFAINDKNEKIGYFRDLNKDHGRIETRETYISNNVDFIDKKWTNLKTIIITKNTIKINNKISVQKNTIYQI